MEEFYGNKDSYSMKFPCCIKGIHMLWQYTHKQFSLDKKSEQLIKIKVFYSLIKEMLQSPCSLSIIDDSIPLLVCFLL